jgi:hypothetical protein
VEEHAVLGGVHGSQEGVGMGSEARQMIVPRAPTPLVPTEPLEDYERRDVVQIRVQHPVLKDHTDDEIACLWAWFSAEWMCAGWCSVGNLAFADFLAVERTAKEWAEAWEYR